MGFSGRVPSEVGLILSMANQYDHVSKLGPSKVTFRLIKDKVLLLLTHIFSLIISLIGPIVLVNIYK